MISVDYKQFIAINYMSTSS